MTKLDRRDFLKQAAGAVGAVSQAGHWPSYASAQTASGISESAPQSHGKFFPRRFEGGDLRMIAFPLGGVAAGCVSLGGRGELRDWEIFNRPNKGYRPRYAFTSLYAQVEGEKPVARILEARIQPPYEGPDGLGADNLPGMPRLEGATFQGAYPFAQIQFHDKNVPVDVELEAFSPFIPHDPDGSGLPVVNLRYRARNAGHTSACVRIAYSLENPIHLEEGDWENDMRRNMPRNSHRLQGLMMDNPSLAAGDPMQGSIALAAMETTGAKIRCWPGWPKYKWWSGALSFWDHFSSAEGMVSPPGPYDTVGTVCIEKIIAPGDTASFHFLLGWHFANRTPDWCGWAAPKDKGKTIIGNYYATRYKDAWEAVEYMAGDLGSLEGRTRQFAQTLHESTLPGEVLDAATANLSILASTTCFRTADGEFHGFEGSEKKSGCCFGNCLHVWNYETVTPHLFPSFARSLRRSAFGFTMEGNGSMHFRQLLPDGIERWGIAAADGQMGQIVHAWLDWQLSGDTNWLREMWPSIRKGMEFAWTKGGWDANRDGVLEGVQHNTYDVEFYGPNPMCSIYYLGALRAAAEMAGAVGDTGRSDTYNKLYQKGRDWIDANLFNGEYYVQKIRGYSKDEIAPGLIGGMGAEDPDHPQYQMGDGCLIDQLVGQYLVDVGGMGALVSPEHVRTTLASIYRYNAKRSMAPWENVARTYAVNNEAAVVICDYTKAKRPRVPFPYYSESWTGLEYTLAALLVHWGQVDEGLECVRNTRARFNGSKRNPWNEVEAGDHYVRAMASWSVFVALGGFHYRGDSAMVTITPPRMDAEFRCFWATATGWGSYSLVHRVGASQCVLRVLAGTLNCKSLRIATTGTQATVWHTGKLRPSQTQNDHGLLTVNLDSALVLGEGEYLQIEMGAVSSV